MWQLVFKEINLDKNNAKTEIWKMKRPENLEGNKGCAHNAGFAEDING